MEILLSILRGWDKMTKRQEAGGRPIIRPRNYQETERRIDKWRKKATWYKSGGYSTVLFFPWTPNSELERSRS